MNPPREYTLQELAHDVRTLINHLRAHGVIGLHEGIDFDAVTVVTDAGQEIDVDMSAEIEVEVPPSIVRKIRWYSDRSDTQLL